VNSIQNQQQTSPQVEPQQTEQYAEEEHEGTHYHTGFTFIVNGEVQEYSGIEFMQLSPCSIDHDDEQAHEESTDPKDRIHLHNQIGNVVHVHVDDVTWKELLTSLGVTELVDLPVTAIDNEGNLIEDPLNQKPKEYGSAVFQFGEQTLPKEELMKHQVSKEEILDSEAKVENCGK